MQSNSSIRKYGIAGALCAVAASVALCFSTPASADTWHASLVENVYPLGDGTVVLVFRDDAAGCTSGVSNKYHYIRAGVFGVTAEGVRAMLATVLTAYAMDRRISLLFDETSGTCNINRLLIVD